MSHIIHRQLSRIVGLILLLFNSVVLAANFEPITFPSIDYPELGNQLGIFGSYNAISFYSFINASSFLTQSSSPSSNNNLFLRDTTNNNNIQLANLNGQINQILSLSQDTIILNGNFTSFNNQNVSSPIIYNITSNSIENIISPSSSSLKKRDIPSFSNGTVNTMYVDNDLIYLGGDFEFNGTYGAAIYNQTSKQVSSLPFQGFGQHAIVNAITKVFSGNDQDDQGSIIFGGNFNTLGLSNLLIHNITTNTSQPSFNESQNASLIMAEQLISLKHGIFTNVNGAPNQDGSSIICPSNNPSWTLNPDSGGQWLVELPDEMKGITPTKARLYIPPSDDGIQLFRIYSYPNNGIMNLTYIDPSTNQIAFCDAWCPLLQSSELIDYANANKQINTTNQTDSLGFIDENGSFSMYYDPTTKTKTLGYGAGFQEFAFVNEVGINQIGVTATAWYGSEALFGGFELYQNAIYVYGNDTLNEPNCAKDTDTSSFSVVNAGNFESIRALDAAVTVTDYLVAQGTDSMITLYPNISYSGNYSIIMTTPGCTYDNSCAQRSIVNVTVLDTEDNVLTTSLIFQNNNNDKFDYLFYGHLNGTSESSDGGQNRIEISFHDTIIEGTSNPWVVVDKIVADIVTLDKYFDMNSTNSTSQNYSMSHELTYLNLNGLFEYSLANFTNFDESLVSSLGSNNQTIISLNNTFVGNSTINVLSSQLSDNSTINQFTLSNSSNAESLLLLGDFTSNSHNLTLSNSNVINLSLGTYNTTANETNVSLISRSLSKRDDSSSNTIFGGLFNNSISKLVNFENGIILLGQFNLVGSNSSVKLNDLSNNNSSTTSINNFAYYSNNQFFGFGNQFIDQDFDQFSNLTINNAQYFIFSSSQNSSLFKTWDNTQYQWVNNSNYQLNINQAINVNPTQQILGGESFNIMDWYNVDQSYTNNSANFSSYNLDISGESYEISESFYVNSSLSVIGGKFSTSGVTNIAFINNSATNSSILSVLGGDITWGNETEIETLYVDNSDQYLFIGTNGPVEINNSNVTGVAIYDLQNNTFTSFQPAQLSNEDGSTIEVNAIALYDQGSKLLVGGKFTQAGSLNCAGLCVYDLVNTRWLNPQSDISNTTVSGTVSDIKFVQSNEVLISGNLTVNNMNVNFITYDFVNTIFNTKASLNQLGSNKVIKKFILNDYDNTNLNGRLVAYGDDFISGFDGSNWYSIDDEIEYDNITTFNDLKLFDLSQKTNYNQTLFDNDMILALAGTFTLTNYGTVNLALFNGTDWIPFAFTSNSTNQIGSIKSLLINDSYRFQSSDDITNSSKHLSAGKVVGISMACALGSTSLMGLLYIIPFYALFRKRQGIDNTERIHENDMIDAVNPQHLLHEMDLQRNT
ncbi:cortical protein marker for cell polarity-domain-containing protein [Scheffersomyces coipomensis]|uniref:cortical protein marker for cell polarity-domain-containing protein n=1 Tax=Scheffersomyces coipomensis TaxID=1788519 RepID=UPI00315CEF99